MKKKTLSAIVITILILALGAGVTAYAAGGVVNKSGGQTWEVNPNRGDWTQVAVADGNGYTTIVYINTFRSDTSAGAISNPRKYADDELTQVIQYAKDNGWTVDEPSKDGDSQYADYAKTAIYLWYHYYDRDNVRQKMYFSFIQEVKYDGNGQLYSTWSQAKNGEIVMTGISTASVKEALYNCRYDSYCWKTW